jgi:hypothetical protein
MVAKSEEVEAFIASTIFDEKVGCINFSHYSS